MRMHIWSAIFNIFQPWHLHSQTLTNLYESIPNQNHLGLPFECSLIGKNKGPHQGRWFVPLFLTTFRELSPVVPRMWYITELQCDSPPPSSALLTPLEVLQTARPIKAPECKFPKRDRVSGRSINDTQLTQGLGRRQVTWAWFTGAMGSPILGNNSNGPSCHTLLRWRSQKNIDVK